MQFVAERDGIADDLGIKYVCRVLRSRASGATFLANPTSLHRLPLHAEARLVDEPGGSQANAKLVFRTVLTIDGPEGDRHCVPLKRRKAFNPLVRKTEVSN